MPWTESVMPEIPGTWSKTGKLLDACPQCGALRWIKLCHHNRLCKSCGNGRRVIETEKTCINCGKTKPTAEFYKSKGKNSFRSNCKECTLLPRRRTLVEKFYPGVDGLKTCTSCGERKSTSEFHPRSGPRVGFRAWCRVCTHDAMRKQNRDAVKRYTAKNPEKVAEMQRQYALKTKEKRKQNDSVRHNLRLQKKWQSAGSPRPDGCEICGRNQSERPGRHPLVFDHCHASGKFRGWLCDRCNMALGLVSDNTQTLKSMIVYLEERGAVDAKAG